MFFSAEAEANLEASGKYDSGRTAIDPEYKMMTGQLAMGAGWWARMFLVHHQPWIEAEEFVNMRYGSDVRRDETISQYTRLLLEEAGREKLNEDMHELFKDIFILERDLYGQYRFDRRGDQVFLLQSVKMADVGRNDESAVAIIGELDSVVKAGHFDVKLTNVQERWKQYCVTCKPETEPAPWWEKVEVPEVRVAAPGNLRIGSAVPMGGSRMDSTLAVIPVASDPDSDPDAAVRESTEFLDAGFVKIHFDTPIVPRRLTWNDKEFKFELAIINPEVGFLPRKTGREYGV